MSPRSASFGSRSIGKCCVSSHSITCGRISASANSRTLRRRISCSSDGLKSITARLSCRYMRRFRLLPAAFALLLLVATPAPARADVTGFLGVNTTPVNRTVKGFAVGAGMLIVGFEAEYCDTSEDLVLAGPRLRTFMFNGLLQTPIPIAGFQFYGTAGGGGYRESFSTQPNGNVTSFGTNIGGGAKISLAGPLRLRVDYRVFTLHGTPRHSPVQRFYAGINLKF